MTSLLKGQYVQRIYAIHEEYGEKVRVAPNEISFATGGAWQDIHGLRGRNRAMLKNPIWWSEIPGRAPSIVSSLDLKSHERMRKVLDHCFSADALRNHESTIQHYTSLMLQRLREKMGNDRNTIVNIVDWYMFLTFDIVGDLGFGESFSCLETSSYHPWLQTLFNYFKMAAFIGSLRIYFTMSIDSIVLRCLPNQMKRVSENHYQWAVDKVHRRMNLETQRSDFMTYILRHNKEDGITTAEIENNSNLLVVAGSETCGTVLSGTTNYLVKTPEVYRKFSREIRSKFPREEDITSESLRELPYLNAVVAEGLRLCPPSASGLSHVVPPAGETVCGDWLPEGVRSYPVRFP